MATGFPYEIRDVDPETNRQLLRDFTGERTGFLKVGPQEWLLASKYRRLAAEVYNFKVRPDDVWVVTFPRSGTTMTQELVWLVANDLDYKTASKVDLLQRFPFIEFSIVNHDDFIAELKAENAGSPGAQATLDSLAASQVDVLDQAASPRFIKTHLPLSLLPPDLLSAGCKVVYVARNPMDAAVSFYYQNRLLRNMGYVGDFPKYWDYFQKGLVPWCPYWPHIIEAWNQRNNPNLLFMFYEHVVKDMPGTIRKVAMFLGKQMTDAQVHKLADHMHIDNFRNNPSVNMDVLDKLGIISKNEQSFIRKGKPGGWASEFTPEMKESCDKWIEENLSNTDLRFPW
ncbi:sulfotransferase 1C4-like [Bacillus rossius redtenbacheri]|uniref:sulfotransferase 1C4-like n=1 Tax=Bacillus rossius redtenbacheri TaxID=93214 RepID=UPI002FDDE542